MTSPIDMAAAQTSGAEQSRQELQAKLNGLGGLSGRKLDPEAKAKKLREACEGFESIFIQKMWQEMRNAVPKAGLMNGREERFWQDMYDQELAKSMTRAGGIGLADMMYEQLSRNLVSASRDTASGGMGKAFTPAAAPLMQSSPEMPRAADVYEPAEQAGGAATATAAAAKMPSVYDGHAPQQGVVSEAEKAAARVQNARQERNIAQAAAVAQAPAGQPVTPGALGAPVTHGAPAPNIPPQAVQQLAAAAESPARHAPRTREHGQSGLELSQTALREAGDKLGARAVRPALHPRRQKPQQAPEPMQASQPAVADNRPGTAAGLSEAINAARLGATEASGQAPSLAEIVARAQASAQAREAGQNAAAPNQAGQTGQAAAVAAQAGQPAASDQGVRKVTYTTNVPKSQRKNTRGDIIRMLNVDNVGVNSKAGQGLAAYHAAQSQAAQNQAQPAQGGMGRQSLSQLVQNAAQNAQPIEPLTAQQTGAAQGAQNDQPGQNFAIPPLTSGDLRG